MDLYLIRHSAAVDPGAPGYPDDALRPLTDKGAAKMVNIALGLKHLGVEFDLILSSPYLRTMDTSGILLKTLKMSREQLIACDNLAPMCPPDALLGEINEKYPTLESLALVGHEPNLAALISLLVGGDAALNINMRKGGVCMLSADGLFHERRATLEWLLTPKQLTTIAGNE